MRCPPDYNLENVCKKCLNDMYVFYKTNTDQMNQITISSLDLNISFCHGLQFLDDRAHFVTGKIHVIEVVRQFLPRILSVINLNFLGAGSLF